MKKVLIFYMTQAVRICFAISIIIFALTNGIAYANQTSASNSLILFGSDDKIQHAIVVDKSIQRLFVYAYNNESCGEICRFQCSTGEADGPKSSQGDKKTPEGVYFFIKQFKDSELSPIYGTAAFPINYPNFVDGIAKNGGFSIWVHGTNKPIKERSSNGCIVLSNSDIERLAKYIILNKTPIIILDKLPSEFDKTANRETAGVMGFLFHWKDCLKNSLYEEYINLYDRQYVSDVLWWNDWNEIRQKLKSFNISFDIDIQNASVFKHNETYVVLLKQAINSLDGSLFVGTKKVFLKRASNHLKIIGEEYVSLPRKWQHNEQKNPLIAASSYLKNKFEDKQTITQLVDGWLQAWSAKDIQLYGDYYSVDFHSRGMNLKEWLKYKNRLNQKYDNIKVEANDLIIKNGDNVSKVYFVQNYNSSGYSVFGKKQLVLIREKEQWKIRREIWNKM